MKNHRARAIVGAALVAIILLGSALSIAQSRSTFGEIIARKLTVQAGGFTASGPVALGSTLGVTGATALGSTLDVNGTTTLDGALGVDGATTVAAITATGMTVNGNANITGTFNASGNSSVGGTFVATGDTSLAADLAIVLRDAIAVTAGGIITPTGTFQEITASGAVSTNLIADAAGSGTILILMNSSANVITLAEAGGNIVMSGDIALGQWDTITLINRSTTWYQLATSNN